MADKLHITYVTPTSNIKGMAFRQNLTETFLKNDIEVLDVDTICNLFPMLSDPKFNTDLICVEFESMQIPSGPDMFDMINTISTIIKSTVYRPAVGKPIKRKTHICIVSDMQTDINLLKSVLGTDIKGVYPRGLEFSIEEKITAIRELSAGNYYIPKLIQERLKPKKQAAKSNEIVLTPREQQILTLIQERGSSNKVIARILTISESTVKLHVGKVLKKYGCKNRTQLALFSKKPVETDKNHQRRSTDF